MIKVFSTTACPFKIAHFVGKAVQNGNLPLIATDTSDTLYLSDGFVCPPELASNEIGHQFLSAERACRSNWRPQFTLESGLDRALSGDAFRRGMPRRA
jgi:hypothetical protein